MIKLSDELKKRGKGAKIFFYPNISFKKLQDLYGRASIYWHAMGYGEDDPKKQEAGLMYRTQLLEDAGMLFVFEKDETRYFWNKNTHISLDIVWIRNNVIVGTSSLPSMENGPHIVMSPEPVDRVLEVNAGWVFDHAIQRGSAVRYKE